MRTIAGGIGATLDEARKGMPGAVRTYSLGVPKESGRLPLAQGVALTALRQGSVCSLTENGTIQPFDTNRPFAGFVHSVIQDRDILVVVDKRGAVLLRVTGLTSDTKIGAPVFATADSAFSLENGVLLGELLSIESFENSRVIVGFKQANDPRPFSMDGRMNERQR